MHVDLHDSILRPLGAQARIARFKLVYRGAGNRKGPGRCRSGRRSGQEADRPVWAGQGKSGGYRTLVATQKGRRWFFLYGFPKNERSNVDKDEVEALKTLAA
jgi:hypothetical protein